jgi:hypothetical protein
MKGSNEDKSRRGGARIYVIVAVETIINVRSLNSFLFLSTKNKKNNMNRR